MKALLQSVTVNTPTKELEITHLRRDLPLELLVNMLNSDFPNWTSFVLVYTKEVQS